MSTIFPRFPPIDTSFYIKKGLKFAFIKRIILKNDTLKNLGLKTNGSLLIRPKDLKTYLVKFMFLKTDEVFLNYD